MRACVRACVRAVRAYACVLEDNYVCACVYWKITVCTCVCACFVFVSVLVHNI